VAALGAATDYYQSVRRKLDQIENDRLKPGTRMELTAQEINAYVLKEAPEGVRNPKVHLLAPGLAKGTALVDFGKLRRAQGYEPGWIMSKLLDGERPISVTARIRSSRGSATVDVQSAQISGMTLDGKMLEFLIQNFLIPAYPDAVVGQPFELGHRIDRLDVQPSAVAVVIGK
jgi:hypothetical protein